MSVRLALAWLVLVAAAWGVSCGEPRDLSESRPAADGGFVVLESRDYG